MTAVSPCLVWCGYPNHQFPAQVQCTVIEIVCDFVVCFLENQHLIPLLWKDVLIVPDFLNVSVYSALNLFDDLVVLSTTFVDVSVWHSSHYHICDLFLGICSVCLIPSAKSGNGCTGIQFLYHAWISLLVHFFT